MGYSHNCPWYPLCLAKLSVLKICKWWWEFLLQMSQFPMTGTILNLVCSCNQIWLLSNANFKLSWLNFSFSLQITMKVTKILAPVYWNIAVSHKWVVCCSNFDCYPVSTSCLKAILWDLFLGSWNSLAYMYMWKYFRNKSQ